MLAVGEQFPAYSLTATVGTDHSDKAFKTITNLDYAGKWKCISSGPRISPSSAPRKSRPSASCTRNFSTARQLLGGSTDSEFVHRCLARTPPRPARLCRFPCCPTSSATSRNRLALSIRKPRRPACRLHRRSGGHHPFRDGDRPLHRAQSAGSSARARCLADRRTLRLQLEEGRADARRLKTYGHRSGRAFEKREKPALSEASRRVAHPIISANVRRPTRVILPR